LFDLIRLENAFESALGKNVDVVQKSTIQNDNSRSGRRFRDHFERDKVLVYENCQ